MKEIVKKIEQGCRITRDEAILLYTHAPTHLLGKLAQKIRNQKFDPNIVTWQIDRNVNITNICVGACKFCNFHTRLSDKERGYVTSMDEYRTKIEQTLAAGGDQLLLQGGMHPKFGIEFYEELFSNIKKEFPTIKLHALGPAEVLHIAKRSKITIKEAIEKLKIAGLESLPGAGAEILDNEIRKKISPGKASADEWLEVMGQAHKAGLATSATMMYGHIESLEQRIDHLIKIRTLQDSKPSGTYGFLAFIAWPFCSTGTELEKMGFVGSNSPTEYLRLVAISRIVLDNVPSIQASWLTVGTQTAQMALHYGANDMGSIMIEENVVSSAGAHNKLNALSMREAIRQAGFTPKLRDQKYQPRDEDFLLQP